MSEWIVTNMEFDEAYAEMYGYKRLVRCKDCRWHIDEQPGMVYCLAVVGGWVEDEWFCKGGERKDDE